MPTDSPESDGTLEWKSTTLVLVQAQSGKATGLGYTYSHECCVPLIREKLFPLVERGDAMDVRRHREKLYASVRNFGRRGIAGCAIAAVEIALWDLKARLLDCALVRLLGAVRERIPVYGSGGFTSYPDRRLRRQLRGWINEGIAMVKMKVGREPDRDPQRVRQARRAIGSGAGLFVDANGAYSPRQALALARQFSDLGVSWFEEPVTSDNFSALRFVRERMPAGTEVSAGEYNYDPIQARQMLEARAVDVLQADATRCGVTGFLDTAAFCSAFQVPFSSHTAPALHGHLCCAVPAARHAEYFHDHVRIEQMFFDGATTWHRNGYLQPDPGRPGLGLEFKARDAARFEVNP